MPVKNYQNRVKPLKEKSRIVFVGLDNVIINYMKIRLMPILDLVTILQIDNIDKIKELRINNRDVTVICIYCNNSYFIPEMAALHTKLGRENILIFSQVNEMSKMMRSKLSRYASIVIGERPSAFELDSLLMATFTRRGYELDTCYMARNRLLHGHDKFSTLMEERKSFDELDNNEDQSEETYCYKLSNHVRDELYKYSEKQFVDQLYYANDIITTIDLLADSNPGKNICTEYAESLIVHERKDGKKWIAELRSIRSDECIEDWIEDIIKRSKCILKELIENIDSMEKLTGPSLIDSIRSRSMHLLDSRDVVGP